MPARDPVIAARHAIGDAIDRGVFPAAVAEVGHSHGVLWREAFGALTFEPGARRTTDDAVFDLASLTKPIATTSVIAQLIADRAVALDDPVSSCFPEWRGADRDGALVRDLLEHAAGLAARLTDPPPESRREFEHDICGMPLEYPVRTRAVYSDLGFILLGFLAGDRGRGPIVDQFGEIVARVAQATIHGRTPGFLAFTVPPHLASRTVPTRPLDEDLRRGRLLVGEVHDCYAARLGGAAGHAGLFGTAEGVGDFAQAVLRAAKGDGGVPAPLSPALVDLVTRRSLVPGSSRAIGWDTMRPTSSCGRRMSGAAFGHVGFTGTSLWIDPAVDRYFVLLTNRVCGGGTSEQMQEVRREFHETFAHGA